MKGEIGMMRVSILCSTMSLLIMGAGTVDARLGDRDLEYVISRNEAAREMLPMVSYEVVSGSFVYEAPADSQKATPGAVHGRTFSSLHHGKVLARGDQRIYEIDWLLPGMESAEDLRTRTFAVRNDRYFAMSSRLVIDEGFENAGDVYVYPHDAFAGDRPRGTSEEYRHTVDVLDYGFLSGRLGRTLREEVELTLSNVDGGVADLEILRDGNGAVREYRVHLRRESEGSVTYTVDPRQGFLITRKETHDARGHLLRQHRVTSIRLGDEGIHFPAEVVEVTFVTEQGPDGLMPMPRTETRMVAQNVELLRGSGQSFAFNLSAFDLDGFSRVMVHDGYRGFGAASMSVDVAESLTREQRDGRSSAARTGEGRRSAGDTSPTPTPSVVGSIVAALRNFFSGLWGGIFGSLG